MSLSFFKHKTSIILLSIVNPKLPRDDENRPLMKETTKLSSPLKEVGKLILMRYGYDTLYLVNPTSSSEKIIFPGFFLLLKLNALSYVDVCRYELKR